MSKETEQAPVALVTGGSRGIGAAIVRHLVGQGYDVAFSYARSADAAEALVAELKPQGHRVEAFQADAADSAAAKGLVQRVVDAFGRLDVLVNNAGTFEMAPLSETSDEQYDRLMAINVRAVFLVSRAAAGVLPDGRGRIINIGSVMGERMPVAGGALYGATKAAVKLFTQGWARDLGPRGITVNNVQPGPINTDMNPSDPEANPTAGPMAQMTALGRYGQPDDVAALVAFLASESAGHITGASLNVDGGFEA